MDPFVAISLAIGTLLLSVLNYYLNLAPNADPDQFSIGPREMGVRCDCCFNVLVLGMIAVAFIALSSTAFDSRTELYVSGLTSFMVVTLSGLIGRIKRYRRWSLESELLESVMPGLSRRGYDDSWDEIPFNDDDDESNEMF